MTAPDVAYVSGRWFRAGLDSPSLASIQHQIATGSRVAPVQSAFDVRFVEAQAGRTVASIPGGVACDDEGHVDLAGLLVLADGVLGTCLGTSVPSGRSVSTVTLNVHVHLLEADPAGAFVATAHATDVTAESGTGEGEIRTSDGSLIASVATRCVLYPGGGVAVGNGDVYPPTTVANPAPRAWLDNVSPSRASDSWLEVTAAALPDWGNTAGRLQGGAIAAIGERALHELWATRGLERSATYDLQFTFLAGVAADGHEITARATLTHEGRSLAAARAEVIDRGRVAITVDATRYSKRP